MFLLLSDLFCCNTHSERAQCGPVHCVHVASETYRAHRIKHRHNNTIKIVIISRSGRHQDHLVRCYIWSSSFYTTILFSYSLAVHIFCFVFFSHFYTLFIARCALCALCESILCCDRLSIVYSPANVLFGSSHRSQ